MQHRFLSQKQQFLNLDKCMYHNERSWKNTWIKSIDGQNRYHADHCGKHEELLWIMVYGPYIGLPNMLTQYVLLCLTLSEAIFFILNHYLILQLEKKLLRFPLKYINRIRLTNSEWPVFHLTTTNSLLFQKCIVLW